MRLYHGSKKIVSMPISDHKSVVSDFGRGFYATESEELAGRWAASDTDGGFINKYELDTGGLRITDLGSDSYTILNWLALILSGRYLVYHDPRSQKTVECIIHDNMPDINGSDIIKGYSADGTTLLFCLSYLEGKITLEQLETLILEAGTGDQVLLASDKAFTGLEYIEAEPVSGSLYYPRRLISESDAMQTLADMTTASRTADIKIRGSYNELYLPEAMRCLGELTEYLETGDTQLSVESFLRMFVISGYAARFEAGDPRILSGSGIELYLRVTDACGITDEAPHAFYTQPGVSKSYWCGSFLAYYQWSRSIPFSEIINSVSYGRLRALHPTLHDLPYDEAAVIIDRSIKDRSLSSTRLQGCRKRLGMSQKELSKASDVNIRTLQQYEIGDKNINNAAACKVLSLSKALYCSPGDILNVD